MSAKKVDFGKKMETGFNGVFGTVYTKDVQPWLNYKEVPEDVKKTKTSYILLLLRWDGTFGFPGGFVGDNLENETILDALGRELEEEAGLRVEDYNLTLEPVVSHQIEERGIVSLYAGEVSNRDFEKIVELVNYAEHMNSEVLGAVKVPLYIGRKNSGLPKFLLNNFAPSVKEELIELIVQKSLMPIDDLKKACEFANIDYAF